MHARHASVCLQFPRCGAAVLSYPRAPAAGVRGPAVLRLGQQLDASLLRRDLLCPRNGLALVFAAGSLVASIVGLSHRLSARDRPRRRPQPMPHAASAQRPHRSSHGCAGGGVRPPRGPWAQQHVVFRARRTFVQLCHLGEQRHRVPSPGSAHAVCLCVCDPDADGDAHADRNRDAL